MRHFKFSIIFVILGINYAFGQRITDSDTINIGGDRQLFVDDYLLDHVSEGVHLQLHNPIPAGIAMEHDAPWEGNSSVYHSVFKDGDIYRMYYRGSQIDIDSSDNKIVSPHPVYFCYAESSDGIHWEKPNLGLYEYEGSKNNNIILTDTKFGNFDLKVGDNASFFIDTNPDAKPEEKYKAFVKSNDPHGLFAFKSGDAIHWAPMSNKPVITNGAFDSQNIGFWDSEIGAYRAYWRYFHSFVEKDKKSMYAGVRSIRTATSQDFISWTNEHDLEYINSPYEQLYTNQIAPYYRAPQILLGTPNRYVDRGWSDSMEDLPEYQNRGMRSKVNERYGTALTDALLMSSRNGVLFNRWNEAFFRPGIERPGTWNYGQHYVAWGMVETKSDFFGAPNELSFYSTEGFWTGRSNILRRYTLRVDGFVSVRAPRIGGEVVTKPIQFDGEKLYINFSTSVAGSIRVEVLDHRGIPIPGFTLKDCEILFGDALDREVRWSNNAKPGDLVNKNIRLKFYLEDADLYSFLFE